MVHLIDKDALMAEIEKLKEENKPNSKSISEYIKGGIYGFDLAIEKTLSILNTLEVREVNFKETKSVFEGQYLTKDKVVTTIERLQDECEEQGDNNGVELLEKLFNKLDTLVVKEVDLEKHLKEDIEDVFFDLNGVAVKGATHYLTVEDVKDIAKHFFKLGIQAQKGE